MYRKILDFSKRLVPKISETESIALNSGTTSVEKYFFKGSIPKNHIKNTYVYPKISPSSIINTSVKTNSFDPKIYLFIKSKNFQEPIIKFLKSNNINISFEKIFLIYLL